MVVLVWVGVIGGTPQAHSTTQLKTIQIVMMVVVEVVVVVVVVVAIERFFHCEPLHQHRLITTTLHETHLLLTVTRIRVIIHHPHSHTDIVSIGTIIQAMTSMCMR